MLVLLMTLALLSGCDTQNGSPQKTIVDSAIDTGFDYLLAPNVVELEDGIKVHPLHLGPSIAYLIESESGLVLVDAGMPKLDKIILAYLKKIGRDDLKLIYITHAHLDHYGSAEALREATGAQITVHEADADVMTAGKTRLGAFRDWETLSEFALPTVEDWLAVLKPTPPDFVVEDGDRLDEFGIDAYVVHTPGHTPGSSVLMLNDRYAFAGDLVSGTGSPHPQSTYAYDWDQLADSLKRVQSLNPELVFAGHGTDPITGEEFQELEPAFKSE
jgi:hydroxyacylglutathione hydrolase